MPLKSTKTYTHAQGLSCCFRQWRAKSHCRFVHGYALEIRIEFGAHELDENGWVMDFGALKGLKALLEAQFDHQLLVAADDPLRDRFELLHELGAANVQIVPRTGCEAFAVMVFEMADGFVREVSGSRVWVASAEVREHQGNSAIYSAA